MASYAPPACATTSYPSGGGLDVLDSTVIDWIDAADAQGNLKLLISVCADDISPLTSTSERVQREFVHDQFHEYTQMHGLAYVTAGIKSDDVANATQLKVLAHHDYHNGYSTYLALELFLPGLLRLGDGPKATALLPEIREFYAWVKAVTRPQTDADDRLRLDVFRAGPKYGMDIAGKSDRKDAVLHELNTIWRPKPWFAQWEQDTVRAFKKSFRGRPHSWVSTNDMRSDIEKRADYDRFRSPPISSAVKKSTRPKP